jgi:hypothetical protein
MEDGERDLLVLLNIRKGIMQLSNNEKNLAALGKCVLTCILIRKSKSLTYIMFLAFKGKSHVWSCIIIFYIFFF